MHQLLKSDIDYWKVDVAAANFHIQTTYCII